MWATIDLIILISIIKSMWATDLHRSVTALENVFLFRSMIHRKSFKKEAVVFS